MEDFYWFNKTVDRLVDDEVSPKFLDEVRKPCYFSSFMRYNCLKILALWKLILSYSFIKLDYSLKIIKNNHMINLLPVSLFFL